MTSLKETTDYENFDPVTFMETYKWREGSAEGELYQFILDAMHAIFNSGTIDGHSLLDIGTGATIKSVICARAHVREIYLSDINQPNRDILTKWWKSAETMDKCIVEYIIKKENSRQSVEEMQNILKRKICGILPVDVRSESPLAKGNHPGQFDVITTCLCFQSASHNLAKYQKVIQNAASLLKKGGHLIDVGLFDNEYYEVGKFRFLCVCVNKEDIERMYKASGFHIIDFITKTLDKNEAKRMQESKWSGQFVLHAVKN